MHQAAMQQPPVYQPADLYSAYVQRIRRQRIVWHFCTPKSASTFFMRQMQGAVEGNPIVAPVRCVPVYQNRPQVVCPYTLILSMDKHAHAQVMLAPHLHAIASCDLLNMISENHIVIVQSRALLDTIVSLRDQLDKHQETPFGVMNHHIWNELTPDEKIERLIMIYLPWHVQFIAGWEEASKSLNVKWLDYSEAVADPNRVTREAFGFHGIQLPDVLPEVRQATNFNVGKSGRGAELLTSAQKVRIAQTVAALTSVRQPAHLQL